MSRIYEALKRAEQIKGTSQSALLQEGLSQPACVMPVADSTASFMGVIPQAGSGHSLVAPAVRRYEEAPRVEWVRRDGGIRPAFILDGRSQVRG